MPAGRIFRIYFSACSASCIMTLMLTGVCSAQQVPQPGLMTLQGHTDPVYSVGFLPEGKIVTASFDKTLRVWDVGKRETVQTFNGHTGIVLALAVSHDGKRIASGALDNTIKLWTPDSDKPTHNLTGHGSQVYGLAFSPDDNLLASASNDKTVRLWDMKDHKQLRTLSTQGGAVYAVAFTSDGKSLLTCGADRTVRLINVENGTEIRQYTGPEQAVYSVALSPDGKTVAAGGVGLGNDRKLFLWNIDKPEPEKVIGEVKEDIYRVQFNRQGNRLLSIGYAGTVTIRDVASGDTIFTAKLPVVTYGGCYSPDGKQIAVAANDGKAYLIDVPQSAQ